MSVISKTDNIYSYLEFLLGEELPAFLAALALPALTSIRRNPRKPSPVFAEAEPIPWCPSGRYLPERPVFALDPLWHGGAYYAQEPSSMFLAYALSTLHFPEGLRYALDLCAAPGGKTTLLGDLLQDDTLLVANEVIRSRVRILEENVTRWGWPNVLVSNHDPEDFAPLTGFFDLVLVDAPCSGEGLLRKDPEALQQWSPEVQALCVARQKRIVEHTGPLVRPGGFLIYSTCTFNPAENDGIAETVLASGQYDPVPLVPPTEWGLMPTRYGVQCWPHRVRGEGFYLSVLRRRGESDRLALPPSPVPVPSVVEMDAAARLVRPETEFRFWKDSAGVVRACPVVVADPMITVANFLRRSSPGMPVGILKGKDFIPAHDVAVSVSRNTNLPTIAVTREDGLRFLRKDSFIVEDIPMGWHVVTYHGVALGWVKVLPGRVNNYLPTELRLRLGQS